MANANILIIFKDGEQIKSCPIESDLLLGRSDACAIRLDDRAISRKHLVFRVGPDGVQVERRSAFAPLVINGKECERAIFKGGDIISLGPYTLKLIEPAHPVSASAPSPVGEGSPGLIAEAVSGIEERPSAESPGAEESVPGILGEIPESGVGDALATKVDSLPSIPDAPAEEVVAEKLDFSVVQEIPEDAATRVGVPEKLTVKLVFPPGACNVDEFVIEQEEVMIGRAKPAI